MCGGADDGRLHAGEGECRQARCHPLPFAWGEVGVLRVAAACLERASSGAARSVKTGLAQPRPASLTGKASASRSIVKKDVLYGVLAGRRRSAARESMDCRFLDQKRDAARHAQPQDPAVRILRYNLVNYWSRSASCSSRCPGRSLSRRGREAVGNGHRNMQRSPARVSH